MEINVAQIVKDLKGNPVKDRREAGTEDLTLRDLLYFAVVSGEEKGKNLSIKELVKRKNLAQRILSAEESLELKSEDISLLKQLIANLPSQTGFNPIVAAIGIELIDPDEGE